MERFGKLHLEYALGLDEYIVSSQSTHGFDRTLKLVSSRREEVEPEESNINTLS